MPNSYEIIDHSFDVIVLGAGGAGLRATLGMVAAGLEHRLRHQGLSDAQPHRRRAGRHQRGARQHGEGRLALAHVRHGQGLRLARGPGCDRLHVPRGDHRGHRARAFRRAVQPHRGRQDLPAPLRRAHDGICEGRHGVSEPAPPPTAPATRSCTRSTSNASSTRRASSSSILPSTC